MNRGFAGVNRPLLANMIAGHDDNQGEPREEPIETQPLPNASIPSISQPTTKPHPDQELETETELHGSSSDFVHTPPTQVETSSLEPTEHTFEQPSTEHQPLSPRHFEEVNTSGLVNTGGLGFSTGSGPVSSDRGQREGKALMIVEETQAPKRTKEQIQQEEASFAEAVRLQNLEEEETAKQVHLDALLAKRLAKEEELTEQQKKRKAQVQFEA
ncbi:hypothetical protein Tco_0695137 [Tanacetum coccineum]